MVLVGGTESCGDGTTLATDGGYGVRLAEEPFAAAVFPCEAVPKERRVRYADDSMQVNVGKVWGGGLLTSLGTDNRTDTEALANLTALEEAAPPSETDA